MATGYIQVQAWRADLSTAGRAKEVWSTLGATNTIIAKMLNALATTAAASGDSSGAQSFDAGAKVC